MEVAPPYTLLLNLFTLYNTVYTIQTALHCLNSRVYAFEYCLERLEGELE